MNMQHAKKLTSTLLACTLMLGSAIGVSAAETSKETDTAVEATIMKEAITVGDATEATDDLKPVKLSITRTDKAIPDGMTCSVVPLTKIVDLSDVKADEGQTSMKAIPLTPSSESIVATIVKADGEESTMKAVRLVPANAIPMEKITLNEISR